MTENWKDIPNYEGLYEISNLGRIRNVITKHIKTPFVSNNGYLKVRLYKNDGGKNYSIHRLVAQSFIPNPCYFKEVNHKDEDILNNTVQNLEWCDRSYNNNYGHRNQKVSQKLSVPVKRISELGEVAVYPNMHIAAKETELSLAYVSNLCNKKRKQKGYIWEKVKDDEKHQF